MHVPQKIDDTAQHIAEVGSIIVSTGHKLFDMDKRPEYGYGRYDDVITQSELGRITGVNGPTKGKA